MRMTQAVIAGIGGKQLMAASDQSTLVTQKAGQASGRARIQPRSPAGTACAQAPYRTDARVRRGYPPDQDLPCPSLRVAAARAGSRLRAAEPQVSRRQPAS